MTEKIAGKDINLRFPKNLVHRYGAKAGVLMYVAEHLPNIPQAPMVVSEVGESHELLLKRADKAEIGWPRLFRSSAEAELIGYEGDFPTVEIDSFKDGHEIVKWNPNNYSMYRDEKYFANGLKETIERVRYSPLQMKERGKNRNLPDEINVIVAEKAKSKFIGTYIKHPNKNGVYLLTITDARTIDGNALRSSYEFSLENGLRELPSYGTDLVFSDAMKKSLSGVIGWHDKIKDLSDMDSGWSYQIEFGIEPQCLFQVRPFKPAQKPLFQLPPTEDDPGDEELPIVIGVTDEEGQILKVVGRDTKVTNSSCLYIDKLRYPWGNQRFPNLKASILTEAYGFLQHKDVQVMRRSNVVVLLPGIEGWRIGDIKPGDRVTLKSDGERFEITKL